LNNSETNTTLRKTGNVSQLTRELALTFVTAVMLTADITHANVVISDTPYDTLTFLPRNYR